MYTHCIQQTMHVFNPHSVWYNGLAGTIDHHGEREMEMNESINGQGKHRYRHAHCGQREKINKTFFSLAYILDGV